MALIQASAPLCSQLRRALPVRPFQVRFWDGGTVASTEPESPTFFVRSPRALAHFLRAPGTLGLGRAYVDGSLDVDDLDRAFIVVDEWEPPSLRALDRLRIGLALAAAAAPGGIPRRPALELLLDGQLHSVERDQRAVRYHYDVGNDFFALFLDESMTYSCAIFSRGASTLEQAQHTKLDLIANKLELREGMRVLDVGCGWGSFAIHAAGTYGV
ncbi:MAG TPA: class I SAM-dependent methyltransferase, partial [Solirubrobacteraceae bacterium]|nr:class I SAM-dependent methyltransferase [Solirubrobacteraceae bacterium]